MQRPVWTTPPWTRAPLLLRRQPAVAIAVAVTSALLGLACAALPLYLASAGSAAVNIQVKGNCPSQLGDDVEGSGPIGNLATVTSALQSRSNAALHNAGANVTGLEPAVVTAHATGLTLARPGIPTSTVQIATRTNGLRHIAVVSRVPGPGVYVSDDLAATQHVRAGDSVTLGAGHVKTTVRVAGIYRNLVGTALPQFWCTQMNIFGTPDENAPPPPVILADTPNFVAALNGLHIQGDSYEFERYFGGRANLPESRLIDDGTRHFTHEIGQADFSIPGAMPDLKVIAGYHVYAQPANQLDSVVQHASAVRGSLRGSIGPVSLAGAIVAVLLVGLAGSYWVDRRRIEVRLLGVRGVGATALGFKAALETLVPVAVGVVGGWALGLVIIPVLGPSSILTFSARTSGLELAAIGGVIGLALVGVVAGFRSRAVLERPIGKRTPKWAMIPFELLILGYALYTWRHLGQVSLETSGNSAPKVPTGFLVFPLLFLLSLAILGGRLFAILLLTGAPSRSTVHTRPPLWLAVRRLAGGPQLAAVLLLSTIASIGVLVYAASLTRSQEATLHAKAELFVGSDTSAQLDGRIRIPSQLAHSSTLVDTSDAGQVGINAVHIIGVDPTTFTHGAFVGAPFSAHGISSLLQRLQRAHPSNHRLPVIAVGNLPAGGLNFVEYPAYGNASLDVVAYLHQFPGENGDEPLLVTTQSDLKVLPVVPMPALWARGDEQQVLDELNHAGDFATIVVSTHDVVGITSFAAVAWTFAYLQSLGVLVGIVTVGGLLLFLTTRARARGLAYVLSRRMGLRRGAHALSLAIEIGIVLGLGGLLGGVIGWLAVEMAGRHLNPLPDLSPGALIVVPATVLLLSLAAVVVTWLLSIGWAQRAADRTRPAELLRLDA